MSSKKNIKQKKTESKFSGKRNYKNNKVSLKKKGGSGWKALAAAATVGLLLGNVSGTQARRSPSKVEIEEKNIEEKSFCDRLVRDDKNPYDRSGYGNDNQTAEADAKRIDNHKLKDYFIEQFTEKMKLKINDKLFLLSLEEKKNLKQNDFSKEELENHLDDHLVLFFKKNQKLFEHHWKDISTIPSIEEANKITKSLLKVDEAKLRGYYDLLQKNLDVGEEYENSGYKLYKVGLGIKKSYDSDKEKYGPIAKLFHQYIDKQIYPSDYPVKSQSEAYLGYIKKSKYVKNSILLLQENFKEYYAKNSSLYGKFFL